MKVLYIASWWPQNNNLAGTFVREHAKAIALYHEVTVLNVQISNEWSRYKKLLRSHQKSEDGMTIYEVKIELPNHRLIYNRYAFRLLRSIIKKNYLKWTQKIINAQDIDLIQINVLDPASIGIIEDEQISKLPIVLLEHSGLYFPEQHLLTGKKWKRFHDQASYWFSHTAIDRIISVSSKLRQVLITDYHCTKPIHVVPNVVIPDSTPIEMTDTDSSQKVRIFLAALWKYPKNLNKLLNSLESLDSEQIEKLEISIAGVGEQYEAFKENPRVSRFNIVFLGQLSSAEVHQHLVNSDVLVHPTDSESFSCIVAESLYFGTPVLSTDTGAIKEMVGDEGGVVVEVFDQAAFDQGLQEILRKLENKEFDRQKIKAINQQKFSSEVVGKQISDVYESVISRTI